jgi:hypothetical protein
VNSGQLEFHLRSSIARWSSRFGQFGEVLSFGLVAEWAASSSNLGKIDWKEKIFHPEIRNLEFDNCFAHIATTELVASAASPDPVAGPLSGAVPLSVKSLPRVN